MVNSKASRQKKILKDAVEWDSAEILRKNQFAVDSRDANLHMLYNRVLKNPSLENN